MNETSLFSKIALVTTVLGLTLASPVLATAFKPSDDVSIPLLSEQAELLPTPPALIAARRCVNRRVYHQPYYTRGVFGRRVYHKGYYTVERVCY